MFVQAILAISLLLSGLATCSTGLGFSLPRTARGDLGEECGTERIQCLICDRTIWIDSKEIVEQKRYETLALTLVKINPRTGGTGYARGCNGSTATFSLAGAASFFDGRNTANTTNTHIKGFFNTDSSKVVLNDKLDTNSAASDLILFCDNAGA
ncbi:hypothetical protein BDZ90DRAFT_229130 [Jaminaea rosea]|uniref:Uncharacterized protein n=1 Tax=Jaminaea rosea TaxID=1569628 RepID=A0A316V1Q0_9BASI|nr:hypothetical protein BDZ90DRAFT_229130 [Jaminaea rosea]PWN30103.1 hypothetical protein BDZ90DRAFT_229130 [Jaminaea rosea]